MCYIATEANSNEKDLSLFVACYFVVLRRKKLHSYMYKFMTENRKHFFFFFFKDTEVISKSTSSLNNQGNVLLCMSAAGCNTALNCRSRSMNRHFS